MKTTLRHIVSKTYKPLLEKYLSRTRPYTYDGIRLEVPPEVFHPGFFFSTRILLKYLQRMSLKGRSFLEPGCGSGLLSVYAAKQGARVVASDINPVAVHYLRENGMRNSVELAIYESDLFREIPVQIFDVIAINPPYYKKTPANLRDLAWYCGENGEYFEKLFAGIGSYSNAGTQCFMILFEGCDMEMIENIASSHGFDLLLEETHRNMLEKNFIYRIRPVS